MPRRSTLPSLEERLATLVPGQGALYTRESLRKDTSESSESQHHNGSALSKRLDLPEPRHFREVQSASHGKRHEYELIVAGIEQGLIPWVICRDDDRLVRNPAELERLIPILMERQVPIYFYATSDYDLSTSDGRMLARIRAAIARSEVEKKSRRHKEINEFRASEGKPYHVVRGFGFAWEGTGRERRRVQDQEEAKAIVWAKDHVLAGGTITACMHEWNRLGLLNQHGRPFTWKAAKEALLNPALCGYRVYQPSSVFVVGGTKKRNPWEFDLSEMVKGNWKAILTTQEWLSVRDILTKTKQQAGNHIKYLGSGIYECGRCDDGTRLLSSHQSKKDGGNLVYRCVRCYKRRCQAVKVDSFVTDALGFALLNRQTYEAVLGSPDKDSAEIDLLLAEEVALDRRLDELADSHAHGRIPLTLMEKSAAIAIKRLVEIREQLSTTGRQIEERQFFNNPDKVLSTWKTATIEVRRFILTSVFPKIVIHSPGYGRSNKPARDWVHIYDRTGKRVKFDPPKGLVEQVKAANYQRTAS